MILVLTLVVTSCANTQVVQNECIWDSVINPTDSDITAMSDQLVKQILDHNDKYVEFCG